MIQFEPIVKTITATSIPDAWFFAVSKVMKEGRIYRISDTGAKEDVFRITLPLNVEIHKPWLEPLAPTMPEGKNIPPPTSEEKIHVYVEGLISGEKTANQHYAYGEDLWWEIEEVINYFKKYGFNTACTHMLVGRPESLLFYNREVDMDEFIVVKNRTTGEVLWTRHITNSWNKNPENEVSSQCLRGIQAIVIDNKLHFFVDFRSNDLWGGFPENYGGIQLIKEYMIDQIGMGLEDGPIIAKCPDLHIYDSRWPYALALINEDESLLEERIRRKNIIG